MMLILGGVAILAVIGLIPLAVALYSAYGPQLTAVFASEESVSGQLQMPDVVGLEEGPARTALTQLGLEMVVEGEESHPTWPVFTVIRQSVAPGSAVQAGDRVSVVLSQGPPLIEVPDVTGLSFEEGQQQLTTLDLVAQKYEDWSAEPLGRIISQDPPPDSLVANRTLVTLVVSNGSRVPMGANLGSQIGVEAYELPRLQYRAGEAINVTFFWKALAPPGDNYNLFVHLTTPQGGVVSQIEGPPLGGTRPTTEWGVNEVVVDPYQLPIPASTAPGEYQIRIGFDNPATSARLPILEPGRGQQDNLGALILRSIEVIP